MPPWRGSVAGWNFLAKPYYSHRAVSASLWVLFFNLACSYLMYIPQYLWCACTSAKANSAWTCQELCTETDLHIARWHHFSVPEFGAADSAGQEDKKRILEDRNMMVNIYCLSRFYARSACSNMLRAHNRHKKFCSSERSIVTYIKTDLQFVSRVFDRLCCCLSELLCIHCWFQCFVEQLEIELITRRK